MLTEIYIEALLVDENLADQVWEAWAKGEIDDQVAWLSWWLMIEHSLQQAECKLPRASYPTVRVNGRI